MLFCFLVNVFRGKECKIKDEDDIIKNNNVIGREYT
jgi:hypothetical protein